jgi:hypothetical protein
VRPRSRVRDARRRPGDVSSSRPGVRPQKLVGLGSGSRRPVSRFPSGLATGYSRCATRAMPSPSRTRDVVQPLVDVAALVERSAALVERDAP